MTESSIIILRVHICVYTMNKIKFIHLICITQYERLRDRNRTYIFQQSVGCSTVKLPIKKSQLRIVETYRFEFTLKPETRTESNSNINPPVIGRYRFDFYPILYDSYFLVFRTKLCVSSGGVLFDSSYIHICGHVK